MKVKMDLELKDHPGQLLTALDPISNLGGNIKSVLHHHERKTPTGVIPVEIKFKIDNEQTLDRIMTSLKEKKIRIVRVGKSIFATSITLGLIGHIVHSDLKDTIEKIDKLGFAQVVDISLSMPEINKESSAILVIELKNKAYLKKLKDQLEKISKEKDLSIIWSLEDHT